MIMANKIRLRIVTPSKMLCDKEAEMVIMRTTSGDTGILPNHQPLTTTLDYGILRIFNDGKEQAVAAFGGFAQVSPECITILSDAAEWPEEIDVDRAKHSKERAEKRIASTDSSIDILRAELSLRRALIRIEADRKSVV